MEDSQVSYSNPLEAKINALVGSIETGFVFNQHLWVIANADSEPAVGNILKKTYDAVSQNGTPDRNEVIGTLMKNYPSLSSAGGAIVYPFAFQFSSGLAGLVLSEVSSPHGSVFWNGKTSEFQGIKDGMPVFGYPLPLVDFRPVLSAHDREDQVKFNNISSQKLPYEGRLLDGYLTEAVVDWKVGGSSIVFTYVVGIALGPQNQIPQLREASIEIEIGKATLALSYSSDKPYTPLSAKYGYQGRGTTVFNFNPDGEITRAYSPTGELEGQAEKYRAFNLCFHSANVASHPMPVDIEATVATMIKSFARTSSQIPKQALDANNRLDWLIAYKQPALVILEPVASQTLKVSSS